jgi:hypothetical protein
MSVEGLEIVAPVLRGEEGQRELRRVCAGLEAIGATVNDTCGGHVHMGAADRAGSTAHSRQKAFIRNYGANEPAINGFVAPRRQWGGYGGTPLTIPLGNKSVAPLEHITGLRELEAKLSAPEAKPEESISGAAESVDFLSKKSKVKMTNLENPQASIEFRQAEGTLDADRILEWTAAMCALVDSACQNQDVVPVLELKDEDGPHLARGKDISVKRLLSFGLPQGGAYAKAKPVSARSEPAVATETSATRMQGILDTSRREERREEETPAPAQRAQPASRAASM